MSSTFYAAFIPGLGELAAEIVAERLPDAVFHKLLDGAVLFETNCTYDQLNFFCFNNIFACVNTMEHTAAEGALESHINAVIRNPMAQNPAGREILSHNSAKIKTFRIVVSQENKPAAVNEKLRSEAEQYIARVSGLRVNRSKPDTEFWFLYRSEGISLFMKRLTLRPSWEKTLHPGELPPPLAWSLCRLAAIRHSDTVLDPFCGYGSIPHAALKHFHITKCIANDNDNKAAAYTAARFKDRTDISLVLHRADFRLLPSILPEKSIDAIITDPPWGFYHSEKTPPAEQLYAEMFAVFDTLLAENGRLVVLSARKAEIAAAASPRFSIQKTIPILLSGKKAEIFVMNKQ